MALWSRVIANPAVVQANAAAEPEQETGNEDYQAANDGRAEVKPDEGRLFHGLLRLAERVRSSTGAILRRLLSLTAVSVNS